MRFLKAERGERFLAGKCAAGKSVAATTGHRCQYACLAIDLIDGYWLKIANIMNPIE